MPWLSDARFRFVGTHFAPPSVACDGGDLLAMDPFDCLKRKSSGVATRITVPAAGGKLLLHLSGANYNVIAPSDGNLLCSRSAIQVLTGDRISIFQRLAPEGASHIKKHASTNHLVFGLLDTAFLCAGRGYLTAVIAVPHRVLVKNMSQSIPLRPALQRHNHKIIRRTYASAIEDASIRIGARAEHEVDWIDTSDHRYVVVLGALRTVVIEIQCEGDRFPLLY